MLFELDELLLLLMELVVTSDSASEGLYLRIFIVLENKELQNLGG